eukprot:jgi/Ulvmu1/2036/UM120_0032.1
MAEDSYTVHIGSGVAGMVVRGSAVTLESSLPTTAMYEHDGTFIAMSSEGKVHTLAVTEAAASKTSRVFVGIRNHEHKTITLLPAAGEQVVRLRPRLADRTYDAPGKADDNLTDRNKRLRRTTELVEQFGSKRRAQKMGQREEARNLTGLVANRVEMEATIEDLGNRAQEAGLTTAQVMAKVAAERCIPHHDLAATNAADAYQLSSIVTKPDLRHMEAGKLKAAMRSSTALKQLQSDPMWRSLDQFVRYVLYKKQKEGLTEEKQEECSQWLGLYHVCKKMLLLRPGSVLDEAVAPLDGTAEANAEEEEEDVFAANKGNRVLPLQQFAEKCGFGTPAAVVHFAQRFGRVEPCEQGMKFEMSEREKQLLHTTLALCAIRCNTNSLTLEMGRALLKALKPISSTDVRNWLKEIGCKLTALRQSPEGTAFTATLLAYKRLKALGDCLPKIKPRARRNKA